VTNIIIAVTTAGATLTANQCFAGLYNSSGTLLSATANQATNWQTAQLQTMALTSVQTNLAAGSYYIAVVSNGTTQPTLARGSGLTATMLNVGLTTGVGRFLQGPTGQTVLPSSITLGSQTLGPVSFWAALS
jgi:hypothetical protein